jgi:multiple sugar transport system substrate-binding protein
VTLSYMLWDPNSEVGYEQSIAAFEKKYPWIHVNIIQVGYSTYWQKLTTEIASGSPPDLFWDNLDYFPSFVRDGALLNVDQFIKKYHISLSDYYSNLQNLFQYNGQYYAITKDWDTIALVYNKNMLKKAGLPPPTNLTWNPTTGGSLLRYAEDLTLDSNGKHAGEPGFDPSKIVQYGFSADLEGSEEQEGYDNFLAEDGVTPFSNGGFSFATPAGVQVFQFLNNLIYKWHVSPPATVTTQTTFVPLTSLFAPGKVAMYTTGDWNIEPISTSVTFPWGIAPLPSGPAGRVSVTNGLGINISAHTQHPEAAGLLWAWLINKNTESLMSSEGYIWGSMPSVDQLFVDYWAKKGVDVSPYLNEQTGKTVTEPEAPNFSQASTVMWNELNLMFLNQIPVQEGVDTAEKEANAIFNGSSS